MKNTTSCDNIQVTDCQEARQMAWHGKTKINGDLSRTNNHLNGYEFILLPLFDSAGKPVIAETETVMVPVEIPAVTPIETKGKKKKDNKQSEQAPSEPVTQPEIELVEKVIQHPWSILACSDHPEIRVGAPFNPASYKPLGNGEFLDTIDRATSAIPGVQWESVLTTGNRTMTAVSLSIKDVPSFKVGNREFEPYLTFIVGRDKKFSLTAVTSNICSVCQNTINANLSHAGKLVDVRIKLTKNSKAEISNMEELVKAALDTQSLFAQTFGELLTVPVKHSEAKAIFTGTLLAKDFSPEDVLKSDFALPSRITKKGLTVQDISTRALNTVDRMLELFHDDSKGNEGGSLADVLSAVTDFYTHESAGEDKWKQYISSEFGSASRAKQDFLTLLGQPAEFAMVRQAGEKLVSLIA